MRKDQAKIPGVAIWLLKHVLPKQDYIYLNGNFEDMYTHRVRTEGPFKAGIWIWGEIIKSLPGFFYASLDWRMTMFKNYFIITLRNIRKHTLYSVINIGGLSIGMSVCLLIFLWVQDDLGYDRFHVNRHEIAQVYSEMLYSSGESQISMGSFYPLAKVLKEECPEVRESIRYETASGLLLRHADKKYTNDTVALADPSFFKIFSFPFTRGNPANVKVLILQSQNKHIFFFVGVVDRSYMESEVMCALLMLTARALPISVQIKYRNKNQKCNTLSVHS
jgi:putative ABC transport system permease protein